MRSGCGSGAQTSRAIAYGLVVHGGVGSSTRLTGACARICGRAFAILEKGGAALDAAIEAVRLLEDDGRFNAGKGSVLRLDGKTVEMDASVMDSTGRLGAVMALRDVRNPVLAARAVAETPHVILTGAGAEIFARKMGLERSGTPSERALRRYQATLRLAKEGRLRKKDGRWRASDVERLWNFPASYKDVFSTDTVGAVALDARGRLAAANSTGGASPMMLGRVGDTAVVGAGFYVGEKAAIAATGVGEEILRRVLAKSVYDIVRDGPRRRGTVSLACERGIEMFPDTIPVGIIAITQAGCAMAANRRMAACAMAREAQGGPMAAPSSSLSCE